MAKNLVSKMKNPLKKMIFHENNQSTMDESKLSLIRRPSKEVDKYLDRQLESHRPYSAVWTSQADEKLTLDTRSATVTFHSVVELIAT